MIPSLLMIYRIHDNLMTNLCYIHNFSHYPKSGVLHAEDTAFRIYLIIHFYVLRKPHCSPDSNILSIICLLKIKAQIIAAIARIATIITVVRFPSEI